MDNSANFDKAKVLKSAQMHFREGQWDKALAEHEKILAADRDDVDSLAAVGDLYAKKRSFQLAFEFYFKAAPHFLAQGRAGDALQVYQKITKLDLTKLSSDVRMDMNIYKSYVEIDETLSNKRYELAIAPLGKLLKRRPQDPMGLALLKILSTQLDHITPSMKRYQILGDSFLQNGLPDLCWEMYRKAAELDPQELPALPRLAGTFHQGGHDSAAKKAYLYLAEKALEKEDLSGAAELAQKAVELKSLEAGYILGLIHFKNRNWPEAKTELEKLLRIKVHHLGALTHLAKTFTFLGQREKAGETFQKILKIDGNNISVLEAWVDFCLHGKDQEAALPQLTILLEKAVADQDAQRTIQFSRMIIQVRPDLVPPRVKLIELLQTLGDVQGAADACRALAMIYEQQGLLNESSQFLEKANQMDPAYHNGLKVPLTVSSVPPLPITAIPAIPEVPLHSEPAPVIPMEKYSEPDPSPFETAPPAEPARTTLPDNPPSEPPSLNAQMAMAQMCIEHRLWKAAIEIYQQILRTKPDLPEVRKKLNEVNVIYLKQWVEKKK